MPIDIASGAVTLEHEDLRVRGKVPLVWSRRYATSLTRRVPTALGNGWICPYDTTLRYSDGAFEFFTPGGGTETIPNPDGGFSRGALLSHLGACLEVFAHDGHAVVQTWNHDSGEVVRYVFAPGQLSQPWPLVRIEDVTGHVLEVSWAEEGRLLSVRQRLEGRELQFVHEGDRLVEVLLARGGERHSVVTYAYDAEGRLAEARDAAGHADRFEYDVSGRLVREIVRDGGVFHYRYDSQGRCVMRTGLNHYNEKRLRYIDGVRITEVTDSYGDTYTYQFLPSGQVVLEVDPLGGRRTTEYDEHGRIVVQTDACGASSRFAYDERGNRAASIDALGHATTVVFDQNHLPLATTDATGRTSRRVYDEFNQLTTAIDALGHRWEFTHDDDGNVVEIANPLGQRKRQTHRAGVLQTATDWAGHATHFAFDAFGRVTERVGPIGDTTRFQYDRVGNPIQVTMPDGSVIAATYDHAGNMTRRIDQHGHVTRWRYGPCGRLLERTDPISGTVRYVWGSERGRLDALINENDETYRFFRDAGGRIVREVGFDGAERTLRHDAEGRLLVHVNAKGESVVFQRDLLGRTVTQTLPDGATARFSFDALSNLVEATNDETVVRLERDPLGRIVREVQGDEWVSSAYDAMGRLTGTQTSRGHAVSFRLDAEGWLEQFTTLDNRRVEFKRNPFGLETSRHLPSGASIEQTFDLMGRLTGQRARSVQGVDVVRRRYEYGCAGELLQVDDDERGSTTYAHDPAGQLISTLRDRGTSERFDYDAAGNLIRMRAEGKTLQDETLARAAGNKLLSKGNTRYEYDAEGRRTARIDAADTAFPKRWTYGWDALDRLRSVTLPDGSVWRYRYDALGRRIAKTCDDDPTVGRRYVWDLSVVVHEIDAAGAWNAWLFSQENLAPIAKVQDNRLYSVLTDQLGTPLELIDEAGVVVWARHPSTWGGGTSPPSAVDCPIRFQGQWHDDESGLHYNFHRYYDPDCGSFISQDPAGLRAGINLFRYVANPTGWTDPFGLCENEEGHFVYRVLRDDEDPSKGLVAKDPNQTRMPEGHVLHGSKENWPTQYISASSTLQAAQDNRAKYGTPDQRIVRIDTRQASSRTDLTGPGSPLKGNTAKNRANKSQEVLLTGPIPPSAVTVVD